MKDIKKLTKKQENLVTRLFVAREEQRACDMQRYWADVYAPVDKISIIIELFWEEYVDRKYTQIVDDNQNLEVDDIPF